MLRRIDITSSPTKVNRALRRNFYQQIIVLALSTALAIVTWVVIHRAHLETFRSAHGWANGYRQIVLIAKTCPKIQDIAFSNLHHDQRQTLLNEVKKDHESFYSYFRETHRTERSRFPHAVTDQVTQRIIDWIKAVNRFLDAFNGVSSADPSVLANNVKNVKSPCEDALAAIVNEYTDMMKVVAEMPHDVTGMMLLALLVLLTIFQLFLIRSECIKQFASIRLSEELANIIHDIRVPLQVAASAISMILLPGRDPASVKEMIQAIADSLSAMQRLLDTSLLRISTGAKPEPTRLCQVLQDTFTVHAAACKEKGLMWRFYLAPSVDSPILVDASALIQILNNLLSNAVRYTDKGAVSLNVHLEQPVVPRFSLFSRAGRTHTLVIAVTDTGCGIPKDSMSLIFNDLQQIRPEMGFGIGLFTVARLANNLRGRIDLWSELGKGTRFTINIPVSTI